MCFQNERWVTPDDNQDLTEYNPAIHSSTGMTFTSLSGYPWPSNEQIVQTTVELADEFPMLHDLNPAVPKGVGKFLSNK